MVYPTNGEDGGRAGRVAAGAGVGGPRGCPCVAGTGEDIQWAMGLLLRSHWASRHSQQLQHTRHSRRMFVEAYSTAQIPLACVADRLLLNAACCVDGIPRRAGPCVMVTSSILMSRRTSMAITGTPPAPSLWAHPHPVPSAWWRPMRRHSGRPSRWGGAYKYERLMLCSLGLYPKPCQALPACCMWLVCTGTQPPTGTPLVPPLSIMNTCCNGGRVLP